MVSILQAPREVKARLFTVHTMKEYGWEEGAKVWLHLSLHVRSLSRFIYIRTVEALESKDIGAFHFHERDETLYLRHEHGNADTRCS